MRHIKLNHSIFQIIKWHWRCNYEKKNNDILNLIQLNTFIISFARTLNTLCHHKKYYFLTNIFNNKIIIKINKKKNKKNEKL